MEEIKKEESVASTQEEVKTESGKTSEEVKETSSESPAEKEPKATEPSQKGEPEKDNTSTEETAYHKRWAKQKEKLREELNAEWSQKLDQLRQEYDAKLPKQSTETVSVPKWWEIAYGTSQESIDAFKLYNEERKSEREQIKQETIKEYEQNQTQQKQEVEKWNKIFDGQMEELREEGKTFKDDELRDVVARYSPVDEKGVYDFRKAYEILQMEKQFKSNPANKEARKQIASMTAPTKASPQPNTFVAQKTGDYMKMTVEEYMKTNGITN